MAKIYQQLTVTISAKPIGALLSRLNELRSFSTATGVHDNGTGPGPIISRVIEDYGSKIPSECVLSASDFSPAMIEQVDNKKKEQVDADPESLWKRVETSVLDAQELKGIPDDSRSHVTAGWVYFMTPDPQKCLSESKRVLAKDGVLALSSWKGSQWLDVMSLVEEIRPETKAMEGIPKVWMETDGVKGELEKAGFRDVESAEVGVEMTLEEYGPFLDLLTTKMPHMIALTKDYSEEERQRLRNIMLAKVKEFAPTLPGTLHGTSIVAFGRK
ncbi:hypothetical protein M409DRAFT_50175 [Zasmidium cellare ATCC 36951]|uniref:Methyltransferase type 11 domain-containing protein n=1 Tax=Zasmidium cellare ATCC 36951 TaxID=1080233 RepID=A0A6A6D0E9_ZASCE|nr:uncharacterized protein M409DRAFT_50175 [Zasmidium cellare ATCC 36951]KAF2172483.1 hypothetical protein M409DRAFT_50175 [Zasmidium cellare ATCC 36951]